MEEELMPINRRQHLAHLAFQNQGNEGISGYKIAGIAPSTGHSSAWKGMNIAEASLSKPTGLQPNDQCYRRSLRGAVPELHGRRQAHKDSPIFCDSLSQKECDAWVCTIARIVVREF